MADDILQTIVAQRRKDVAAAKAEQPAAELIARLPEAPPAIDFAERLRQAAPMAVLAEVKRASPSKGDIAPDIDASEQAARYATAGAAAISVLTEPKWFKGTLHDMARARLTVEQMGERRPAILRKDFLVDDYQVVEARLGGADAILLIVSCLGPGHLEGLMDVSRAMGMEPLVEVNSEDEMERALKAGATVIGVNNRNLRTFDVDLGTTERLATMVPDGVILIALSGISTREDVQRFEAVGASAILVGESLMRAPDPAAKIPGVGGRMTLVKICGIRDAETATVACEAGADFIGLMFAESKRQVTPEEAMAIADAVRAFRQSEEPVAIGGPGLGEVSGRTWFAAWAEAIEDTLPRTRPMLVGVFANQDIDAINRIARAAGLDLVQLSGGEPFDTARRIDAPTVMAVHVGGDDVFTLEDRIEPGAAAGILLDTKVDGAMGGSGQTFDWSIAAELGQSRPVMLAGGLTPENVAKAIETANPWAVDVSTGVETDGAKDHDKIRAFIGAAKGRRP